MIRIWLDFYEDDMSPWVLSSIHIQRGSLTSLTEISTGYKGTMSAKKCGEIRRIMLRHQLNKQMSTNRIDIMHDREPTE